jgi:ribosome-associated protein
LAKKKTITKKPAVLTAKKFSLEAAKIALERHCTNIVVLDLKGKSPATDYFLIATGTSDRQTRSIADEIIQFGRERGFRIFGRAGYEQGKWILLDFVDVVVHLFDEEFRQYYDLELLWGDAKKLKIEE